MTDATPRRHHILYRWWDTDGRLLYVGKSVSVLNRVTQHRHKSAFFEEAAAMTIERFPTAQALAAAEMAAIRAENPAYNISGGRHNPEAPSRSITVYDVENPPANVAGRWQLVQFDDIDIGDLIRCTLRGHPGVQWQGVVDDEEESEDGDPEWLVHADDGRIETFGAFLAGLSDLYRWTSPDPNDPVAAKAYAEAWAVLAGTKD